MARGGAAAAARCERRRKGERETGDRVEGGGLGARAGVPTRGGWRPAAARPTPAYGRHVAGAGWSEARPRAGERIRGRQAGPLAGPKRKRGWPSSACPFLFF